MSAGWINGWTIFGSIVIPTFALFYCWKRFLFNESGYVFEGDSLRIGSLGGPYRVRIPYREIESVEVFPASFVPLKYWFFSFHDVSRFSGDRVVITREGPARYKSVI